MNVHQLKTWPDPFRFVLTGAKRFEFRKDDRGFEVGDLLELREWSPLVERYSGAAVWMSVLYIARGPAFGIPDGFVVMSIGEPPQGLRTCEAT